jgi:trimeric autotransporter adhesin
MMCDLGKKKQQQYPGKIMKNLTTQLRLVFLLTLVVLLSTAAYAQITPLGDSYTNTADSTTNYGAAVTVNVDGATQVGYIQFDLSGIPAGAKVSQAMLKLYVNGVTTGGSFNVDYVNGAWVESTIDSSNAPALGGHIAVSESLTTASKNQYIQVNITSAVQAWLSGSEKNDGIALVANSSFNATFDSKESTTTSHSPELDIVYAEGIEGVTTASGSGLTGGGTSGALSLGLTTACSKNQVLAWNGTAWACSAAGTGTVTGLTAGTGITVGTGATPSVAINTSVVPRLAAANTFTGNQTVSGNLSATGVVTGSGFQIGSNLFDYGSYFSGNAFLGFAGNTTTTGVYETAVGVGALSSDINGIYNTATGLYALGSSTTGRGNTGVGDEALSYNTTGDSNTGIGSLAGVTLDGSAITGSTDTFLGSATSLSTGTLTNATAIGANAIVSESNALVLGGITGIGSGTSVNVGIGTTAPSHLLEVDALARSAQIAMISSGTDAAISVNNTASGGHEYWIDSGSGNAGVGAGNFAVWDNTAGLVRLAITSNGNVGIGTPYPDTVFSVNGGADKPGGGSWGSFSDRRLKDLDGNFSAGLKEILKINPILYRYKQDNGMGIRDHDEHVGVVAQEIKEVIPEAVTENSRGYLLVNNDPVIWAMLNAIKQQQQLIQKQQQQIVRLKSQVKTIQTTLKASQKTPARTSAQVHSTGGEISSARQ